LLLQLIKLYSDQIKAREAQALAMQQQMIMAEQQAKIPPGK
jgi:hypothetical protein